MAEALLRVTRPKEDVAVLALLDEHDVANVGELRAAAAAVIEEGRSLVLDLAETVFIDSSVIHAIMGLRERAAAEGSKLALYIGARSRVRRVLEITATTEALASFDDLDAAIEHVSGDEPRA